jgi:rhodanese-related sulfurtransferase
MIPQVRPSELAAWIQAAKTHGQPIVLDVREPHELQAASVKSQEFALTAIPMGAIAARLAELDPGRPVACLCHHGARSQRVAAFLAANGFSQVVNIAGGIDAWSLELDPSVARY